jgi:mannose-6-phosphate isomerase-like protein (cupin superfamily)
VGTTLVIEPEQKHRLINDSDEDLEIVEIQTGSYFGEDDIVRYEDDFRRA